jgi:transposase-like protein
MQRIKHSPLRNKIDLAEPTQLRAWTRRLGMSADALKAVVDKVGNSVAAVTKELELQRASHQASPATVQGASGEGELPKAAC